MLKGVGEMGLVAGLLAEIEEVQGTHAESTKVWPVRVIIIATRCILSEQ